MTEQDIRAHWRGTSCGRKEGREVEHCPSFFVHLRHILFLFLAHNTRFGGDAAATQAGRSIGRAVARGVNGATGGAGEGCGSSVRASVRLVSTRLAWRPRQSSAALKSGSIRHPVSLSEPFKPPCRLWKAMHLLGRSTAAPTERPPARFFLLSLLTPFCPLSFVVLSLVESSWATGRVRRRLLPPTPGQATATPTLYFLTINSSRCLPPQIYPFSVFAISSLFCPFCALIPFSMTYPPGFSTP